MYSLCFQKTFAMLWICFIVTEQTYKEINSKKDSEVNPEKTEGEQTNPEKKDVQQMLDEMMVQTMKETEQQQNELDSDLSGTEKIEEVVVKEDSEINDKSISETNEAMIVKLDDCEIDNKKVN